MAKGVFVEVAMSLTKTPLESSRSSQIILLPCQIAQAKCSKSATTKQNRQRSWKDKEKGRAGAIRKFSREWGFS
jgi:hypothetical protein